MPFCPTNDTSQPSAQKVAALIDQIASETGVTVRTLLDDGLPGGPEHIYIGMMVENMRTPASVPGGDPSLMDGVEVGNAPDSEQAEIRKYR